MSQLVKFLPCGRIKGVRGGRGDWNSFVDLGDNRAPKT